MKVIFLFLTVRSMVIQSLENIVREELNRHITSINLHKIALDIQQEEKAVENSESGISLIFFCLKDRQLDIPSSIVLLFFKNIVMSLTCIDVAK